MIDVFGSLRGLLKLDDVTVDNCVFKLHYRVTAVLLTMCSVIVTARQYIGDPIDCVMDAMPSGFADSYCWTTGTYTLPSRLYGRVGQDVIQPGVAGPVSDYEAEDGGEHALVKYHKYYQWVCFVLLFQAAFFYAPRIVWKTREGGLVRSLVDQLRGLLMSDEERADRVRLVVDHLVRHVDELDGYANRYFACELVNLLNVVLQMLFLDCFLDGEFSAYGLETLQFGLHASENRTDPMDRIFPKVTMCTFNSYGPSGSIQRTEGLCVLPVNVVNEKIFVFLWFWFWFVTVVTAVNLVYRLALLLLPGFRMLMLRSKLRLSYRVHAMTAMRRTRIGCWFVLYQLGKNVDTPIFKEVFIELSRELKAMKK